MKYRKLGRTEVKVFELIFGCGRGGDIMIYADKKTPGEAPLSGRLRRASTGLTRLLYTARENQRPNWAAS